MPSFRLKALNWTLKNFEKPFIAKVTDPEKFRRRVKMNGMLFARLPRYMNSKAEALEFEGHHVSAFQIYKNEAAHNHILYFHGGAFIVGGFESHRALLGELAEKTNSIGWLIDYKKAPEHKFPAAVNDAIASYKALLDRGIPSHKITIAGDSAGGALSLILLHMITQQNLPRPASVVAICPLTNMLMQGESVTTNADRDVMLPISRMNDLRDWYLGSYDKLDDPLVSPLFGEFDDKVPVQILIGKREILYSDAVAMAEKLQAQGAKVDLIADEYAQHIWPIAFRNVPESREAVTHIVEFIKAQY